MVLHISVIQQTRTRAPNTADCGSFSASSQRADRSAACSANAHSFCGLHVPFVFDIPVIGSIVPCSNDWLNCPEQQTHR